MVTGKSMNVLVNNKVKKKTKDFCKHCGKVENVINPALFFLFT